MNVKYKRTGQLHNFLAATSRSSQLIWVMLLGCFGLNAMCRAQQQPTDLPQNPNPTAMKAPLALPPTATSDPSAIQLLKNVVEASGGESVWSGIHSSKMRVNLSVPGRTDTRDFLYLDDWTAPGTIKYRRGAIGSGRVPVDHTGTTTFTVKRGDKVRTVPEFDQARLLVGNLPAAAAEIIIQNSSYVAKQLPSGRCRKNQTCIEVYRQANAQSLFVREQEWAFSGSDSLPSMVDLRLPNLLGRNEIWQEFRFGQTTQVNGLTVPSVVELHNPGGGKQIRKLVSFHPNATFDTAAFDQELK
jgi:hypothetical protein